MTKNYWTARSEPYLVEWRATFPLATNSSDIDVLLRFAKEVIEVGSHEAVYRIVETRRPFNFRETSELTYTQYVEQIFAETGILPLFECGSGVAKTTSGQLRAPSRICYYNLSGKLTEEVEDMGLLLKSLRPDDVECGGSFMRSVAPVCVEGQTVSLTKDKHTKSYIQDTQIRFSLLTDIWFPQVLGWLEFDQPSEPDLCRWYDNSELAQCHTPRLNNFISRIRQLVLEIGGEWRLIPPEGSAKHYAPMVREDGIVLDA